MFIDVISDNNAIAKQFCKNKTVQNKDYHQTSSTKASKSTSRNHIVDIILSFNSEDAILEYSQHCVCVHNICFEKLSQMSSPITTDCFQTTQHWKHSYFTRTLTNSLTKQKKIILSRAPPGQLRNLPGSSVDLPGLQKDPPGPTKTSQISQIFVIR